LSGAGPGRFFGAISAVATAGESGEILFLSGKQRTIALISSWPHFTKFAHNTSISGAAWLTYVEEKQA